MHETVTAASIVGSLCGMSISDRIAGRYFATSIAGDILRHSPRPTRPPMRQIFSTLHGHWRVSVGTATDTAVIGLKLEKNLRAIITHQHLFYHRPKNCGGHTLSMP